MRTLERVGGQLDLLRLVGFEEGVPVEGVAVEVDLGQRGGEGGGFRVAAVQG
ncbi:hypothetical protein [Crossiella sp. S99.2]|uniref:hypothetical protein n=1 Tax=Crossiella sp. S99.2 TaxID=2936272 RepID=UPI0020004459|nr:hypothetical protein [Crossiella sp. S99.2]MCK2245462.1 hypothetical protein [Crossiella sp. S99.2]